MGPTGAMANSLIDQIETGFLEMGLHLLYRKSGVISPGSCWRQGVGQWKTGTTACMLVIGATKRILPLGEAEWVSNIVQPAAWVASRFSFEKTN